MTGIGDHRVLDAQPSGDDLALALMGVARRFRIRGLEDAALKRLYRRYLGESSVPLGGEETEGMDEFADLLALLLAHRRDDREEIEWLACAIATACSGDDHLWQDMGLPNRAVLSNLLHDYFAGLYGKNRSNMKWKKFFYRQLCDNAVVNICKAPSCGVCSDYSQCFGSEEAAEEAKASQAGASTSCSLLLAQSDC